MMKRTMLMVLALGLVSMSAMAETTTKTVPVSASVAQVFEVTLNVCDDNNGSPTACSPTGSLAFGALTELKDAQNNGLGILTSNKVFDVFISTNTSSRPYKITQTLATPKTSANVNLPNAMLMNVVKATTNGTTDIAGDTFTAGNQQAVTANKDIYTSNSAGAGSVVQVLYAIGVPNAQGTAPFSGYQPIPRDQAAGSYGTSVVYTIATTV